jgi:glyoxylase-like metal-dependent hydrolase (beta-lactamase superfamily II)
MQALALHEGAIVIRSARWQTTCTILHSGEETFVVDSPIFPDELDALPGIVQQAGWGVSGLLATHGDWDHLLGRLVFPDAALGVSETTAARMRAEPGEAQRRLREHDDEAYVARARPLSLGHVEALPVPGHIGLGAEELEVHPADGHTQDGMFIFSPEHRLLCAGDYLSPCEIPMISEGGSLDGYLATLDRLEQTVGRADWVVPGHGEPLDTQRALAILREDRDYLVALRERGADAPLPLARRGAAMKAINDENVARVSR